MPTEIEEHLDEDEDGEASQSDGSQPGRPFSLNLVYHSGSTHYEYEIGTLSVGEEPARKTVAVIVISEFENRYLVALPHKAWDKKTTKRRLNSPFAKASLCEVVAAAPDDREQPSDVRLKVWVGLLARDVTSAASFGGSPANCDIRFQTAEGTPCFPFAAALVQIADAQFNFVSAVSAGDPYEARFRAIEASLSKIASALQQKTSPVGNAAALDAKTKTRAAPPPGSVPGTPRPPGAANDLAGLDPAVYRSALDSGVSPHELRELGGLLGRRGRGLADFPQAQTDAFGDGPLCAPEGSHAGSSAGSGDPDHRLPPAPQAVSPVEAAVVNLTKIVGELAKAKHTPAKGSDLERALDKAEGFAQPGEAVGSSGGRSKSAAFRILKETLINDPAQIYGPIERLLEEDLLHRRVGSALQDSRATSRAWLEYRSNLGHYPTTTRLAWCIAGIWDALRSQRPEEARARAALAIACVDQQALDGGAWTLAEQFSLEGPPPLASFANRRHQGLEHSDIYHSRIFESRWAELCLHKVRELEQHLEAKRKLAGRGRPPPPDNAQETRGDRPDRGAPKGGKVGEKGADKSGPSGGHGK